MRKRFLFLVSCSSVSYLMSNIQQEIRNIKVKQLACEIFIARSEAKLNIRKYKTVSL